VNVLFLVDGYEESGDPSDTIRMLREAKSDGWLRGEIIGLIINNSQWIDDDAWTGTAWTAWTAWMIELIAVWRKLDRRHQRI